MYADLDELETVQNYIQTLFDTLPAADFSAQQNIEQDLIQQNILYGRKIIELSDKFTAKYRKDHFFNRKDVEDKIQHIYRILCPQAFATEMDEMINAILRSLLEDQGSSNIQSRGSYTHTNSRINGYGSRQSKVEYYKDEAELVELKYEHNSSEPRRMGKSKVSCENE